MTRSTAVSWAIFTLLLGCVGCPAGPRTTEETIASYSDAVQEGDLTGLYCLSAGASQSEELGSGANERRESFERWANAHIEAYFDGRDSGVVALEENPVRLVKLFALGRGTFYETSSTRSLGGDAVAVRTRLHFGYAHQDLSRFSPGTTLYLCAPPAGRVLPVRVPVGSGELTLDVLDSIEVEWVLLRAGANDDCAGGWTVASASPVEGSETTTEITWVY